MAASSMEDLLVQLDSVRRQLEEVHVLQTAELDELRRICRAEKEFHPPTQGKLESQKLRQAATTEMRETINAATLRNNPSGTDISVNIPGVVDDTEADNPKAQDLACTFGTGKLVHSSSGSALKRNLFQLRGCYMKNDAELEHLNRKEKIATQTIFEAGKTVSTGFGSTASLDDSSTSCDILMERLQPCVQHPTVSKKKMAWDFTGCVLLCYDVVVIPMGVFGMPEHTALDLVGFVCMMYWAFDLGVTCITGYYEEYESEPVMDVFQIVRNYVRSKAFVFDLALVVLDWVLTIGSSIDDSSDTSNLSSVSLARTMRLSRILRGLRMLRLARVMKIKSFLETARRWVDGEVLLAILDIFKLACVGILVFHMMACLYYAIGLGGDAWVARDGLSHSESVAAKYFKSYSRMLSRLNTFTRYQETDLLTFEERIFDMLFLAIYTALTTLLTSTVTSRMVEVQRRMREKSEMKDFIYSVYLKEHNNVNPQFRTTLLHYVDNGYVNFLAVRRRQKSEKLLLESLPSHLAREFRQQAWAPLISDHPFFKTRDVRLKEDICFTSVVETCCHKYDIIFKKNDSSRKMYFVFKGEFLYFLDVCGDQISSHHVVSAFKAFSAPSRRHQNHFSRVRVAFANVTRKESTKRALSLKHTADLEVAAQLAAKSTPVSKNSWLSESCLWLDSWEHEGTFLVAESGILCGICVDEFTNAMLRHEATLHDTVRYAAAFVGLLNEEDPRSLSDLQADIARRACHQVEEHLTSHC